MRPRFLIDEMISLNEAAITGLGAVALAGCVCCGDVKSAGCGGCS